MPRPELSALHVYPVKGVRGTSPGEAEVQPWGLAADRRWMVVDADHRQVTQREQPRLALAAAEPLPDGGLELSAPAMPKLRVAVPGDGTGTVTVSVWRDRVPAAPADVGSDWFSAYLGRPVLLVYLADPRARPVDPEFGREGETVGFADGFPLLVTTTASLEALNELVAEGGHADEGPLPMDRFRPNLVVSGTQSWAEDGWRRLRVGQVVFRVAKPCGRCVVTTTDQRTARRGREPLRTLARHRRFGSQLVFGQNLVPESTGRVRSGDQVEVLDPVP
ncbi:MOSC domain-containing protein [Streptomyces sp. 549]|uniref:MOSC domain-containing protein n=1 Tax=Streptomyces sp. 549 TaxID=3049076 RepID=UPI0024C416A2|nr:MOSC N-terminal beta barrel domain-containing protein [Streptomyces sp. 549]MDK1474749.1 MOSC domain-containing protein [Streptomyces sp. 549]